MKFFLSKKEKRFTKIKAVVRKTKAVVRKIKAGVRNGVCEFNLSALNAAALRRAPDERNLYFTSLFRENYNMYWICFCTGQCSFIRESYDLIDESLSLTQRVSARGSKRNI